MQWSRYNRLFRSEGPVRFLYNALTNTLMELDEAHYAALRGLKGGRSLPGLTDEAFQELLREKKILVDPGEEENLLLASQYERHAACFDSSTLSLAICPTLRCNFRCPYCYESSQKDGAFISPETADRLTTWIKKFKGVGSLTVFWYGGEPLLGFDTLCALTEKFRTLDLAYRYAGLVTNGYLLSREKIDRLNELHITDVQITLDGPREVHDTRRVVAGGGPTFDRIMDNVSALLESDYEGRSSVRVNIDKNNVESFIDLRNALLTKFKGKKLSVYAGHVDASPTNSCYHGCLMNAAEWADFSLGLYDKTGLLPASGLHPGGNPQSFCMANGHNAYVVGPEGELYMCWDDVGKTDMVVGNIHEEDCITNPVLRAQYSTGIDPYNDPECRACDVLPICGGGCANKRLRARYLGEKGIEYCSPLKDHLVGYLRTHIDHIRTREMCKAVLRPGKREDDSKGYRVVQLASKKSREA